MSGERVRRFLPVLTHLVLWSTVIPHIPALHGQTMIAAPGGADAMVRPELTVSMTPWSMGATLGSTPLKLLMARVNVYMASGPVTLQAPGILSEVGFGGDQAVPNGTYSVQFAFTIVASPATIDIMRGGTVIKSCQLQQQTQWVEQICDSGVFDVADGRLPVGIRHTSGTHVTLTRITVSKWPAPTLRIR